MSEQFEFDHLTNDKSVSSSEMVAELIDIEHASSLRQQWIDLLNNAITPNPFYSLDFLQASARHLKPNEQCQIVLIWSDDTQQKLIGLFPFSVKWLQHGFVTPVCELWIDNLISCTMPLIADPEPEKVWDRFLHFIKEHPTLPSIVYGNDFYPQSANGEGLCKLIEKGQASQKIVETNTRAHTMPSSSFEDYKRGWSKTRAKNLRACGRKLSAMGEVTFETYLPGQSGYEKAVKEVLDLEAAGWKGKDGNALLSKPCQAAFADELFFSEFSDNPVEINVMRLDGRVIAGLMDVSSQRVLFGVRSAYDESLSNLSPGTLLDTHLIELLCDNGAYSELDSGTIGNHHISNFYLQRKAVQTLYFTADMKRGPGNMRRLNQFRRMSKSVKSQMSTTLGTARGWLGKSK